MLFSGSQLLGNNTLLRTSVISTAGSGGRQLSFGQKMTQLEALLPTMGL